MRKPPLKKKKKRVTLSDTMIAGMKVKLITEY